MAKTEHVDVVIARDRNRTTRPLKAHGESRPRPGYESFLALSQVLTGVASLGAPIMRRPDRDLPELTVDNRLLSDFLLSDLLHMERP